MQRNFIRKNVAYLLALSMVTTGCTPLKTTKYPPSLAQIDFVESTQAEATMTSTSTYTEAKMKQKEPATIRQVANYLLKAADDYSPELQLRTLLKGFKDENKNITREESLIMISRAFGKLPKPTGNNARISSEDVNFTDVSDQANEAVNNLINGGVLPSTRDGKLNGKETVSLNEIDTIVRRIWAFKASNLKDDFYHSINKTLLENIEIPPRKTDAGGHYDVRMKVNNQIENIIKEIASGSGYAKGSKEQKIHDLYNSSINMKKRNELGIKPIQKYLDAIDNAQSLKELIKIQNTMRKELGLSSAGILDVLLITDYKDNMKKAIQIQSPTTPNFSQYQYDNIEDPQIISNVKLYTKILMISGENEAKAKEHVTAYYELEKELVPHALSPKEENDKNKLYKTITFKELERMLPNIDIKNSIKAYGFKLPKEVILKNPKMLIAYFNLLNNDNLVALKTSLKLNLLTAQQTNLSEELMNAFAEKGATSENKKEQLAIKNVRDSLTTYVDQLYVEKHFSKEAKQDIENMIKNLIESFKKRVESLNWMSKTTKEKAIEKLDNMTFFVGYPDKWDNSLDNIDITNDYFENQTKIAKIMMAQNAKEQNKPNNNKLKNVSASTVNAYYSSFANAMAFPAGILQAPFYDMNASPEENLGGIGTVIAHEITHAFDDNGAKFDSQGKLKDWWTAKDYAKFQELCTKTELFYEGKESAPGIAIDGKKTLAENISDIGGVASTLDVLKQIENPDYDKFFRQYAKVWARATIRNRMEELQSTDHHSSSNLRVNRVLVNFEEFNKTYKINKGDGMYVAPKDRISIW